MARSGVRLYRLVLIIPSICSETKPWDGSTGGYGYTQCNPSSEQWQPGDYEVQLFVGLTWISSGSFQRYRATAHTDHYTYPFKKPISRPRRRAPPGRPLLHPFLALLLLLRSPARLILPLPSPLRFRLPLPNSNSDPPHHGHAPAQSHTAKVSFTGSFWLSG